MIKLIRLIKITLRMMMMAIIMTAFLQRCLCQSGTQRSTFCSSRNEYALHTTAIDGKDGQDTILKGRHMNVLGDMPISILASHSFPKPFILG